MHLCHGSRKGLDLLLGAKPQNLHITCPNNVTLCASEAKEGLVVGVERQVEAAERVSLGFGLCVHLGDSYLSGVGIVETGHETPPTILQAGKLSDGALFCVVSEDGVTLYLNEMLNADETADCLSKLNAYWQDRLLQSGTIVGTFSDDCST